MTALVSAGLRDGGVAAQRRPPASRHDAAHSVCNGSGGPAAPSSPWAQTPAETRQTVGTRFHRRTRTSHEHCLLLFLFYLLISWVFCAREHKFQPLKSRRAPGLGKGRCFRSFTETGTPGSLRLASVRVSFSDLRPPEEKLENLRGLRDLVTAEFLTPTRYLAGC